MRADYLEKAEGVVGQVTVDWPVQQEEVVYPAARLRRWVVTSAPRVGFRRLMPRQVQAREMGRLGQAQELLRR